MTRPQPQFNKVELPNKRGLTYIKSSQLSEGDIVEGIFLEDIVGEYNGKETHTYKIYGYSPNADDAQMLGLNGNKKICDLFNYSRPSLGSYVRLTHTQKIILPETGNTFLDFEMEIANEDDQIAQLRAEAYAWTPDGDDTPF